MNWRSHSPDAASLIEEAARLICDEGYADYRLAKLKAAERLGLGRGASLPDNASIEAAVLERQALFGGDAYREQLRAMRRTALAAMKLLREFAPRLSGSAVSGAIGHGHRVQLHLIADAPEAVEILLHDHRIPFDQDERRYRFADGREAPVPLLRMEAGGVGVDLVVFGEESVRTPPLSPVDGRPARRLGAEQLAALLAAEPGL